jgi:hypothetical protein
MAHIPTVACDFDGLVCEFDFPRCGAPVTYVIELLQRLTRDGWHVVIHSCRTNINWRKLGATQEEIDEKVSDMLNFLLAHDVPFHEVWGIRMVDPPGPRLWTWEMDHVGKPVADIYLDDRGLNPKRIAEFLGDTNPTLIDGLETMCQQVLQNRPSPLAYHEEQGR